ncbi:MAG: efflux transporter, outer rane factor lipoprotein NodT family, partial [Gammaproteobacteria bacterium]|nr:efflux transporter, outer rane factor lipoprotein NodT family [Gammaproteobacteria bacterium]
MTLRYAEERTHPAGAAAQRLASMCMVALGATAAACGTFGSKPKAPQVPSPSGYTSPGETPGPEADAIAAVPGQTIALGEAVSAEWWALFRSPDLDTLVKQAIAGSRTLESARERLVAEREALAAARGALYPQVNLNAGVTREKQSAASFGLPPNSLPLPPNFNLYQLGAAANYSLDLFGDIRYTIEQQSALAELERHRLRATYLTLTGNAVMEAILVAASGAQLKAVRDILEIDRQNLQLVRTESQVGSVPESDVVVAESQLAADETLRPGIEQQLSVARHALAVLLGRAPAEWSPPEFDLGALALPGQLPLSLPSALVHQRP